MNALRPDCRVLDAVPAAEGFALGRAMWLAPGVRAPDSSRERLVLREGIERVRRDLEQLLAALPPHEAELFVPELQILDEIGPKLLEREAAGESAEEAIFAETSCGCTDLVIDLRERLLGAMSGAAGPSVPEHAMRHDADLVLLTDFVTPSLVAFLPRQVVAIVAALDENGGPRRDVGWASHAAILARGRGIPIAHVTPDELGSIPAGARLVVEASESRASVYVDPHEAVLEAARRRLLAEEHEQKAAAREPLDPLGIALRVNVGSAHDEIPEAAEGVGLVRTEMMFAGSLQAPSEEEQLAAILRVASKARGAPVVVRLFDAGGDKPIAWLGGEQGESRGIARLLGHPEVLATQLRAVARARERADVRVLLPVVETAEQVRAVRRLASPGLPLGAMVETARSVEAIDEIASASDFVSLGTNDLTASALGLERTGALPVFHPRVLALVGRAIAGAHAAGRQATICGELAGDERGARIAVGLEADAISVAPARVALVRRALARTTKDACRAEALAELGAHA